jgi:hypothetical protein
MCYSFIPSTQNSRSQNSPTQISEEKKKMPKKPSHQPRSHSRRNHFHYTRIKEHGLCACEGGSAYSLIVEAMATTGGGPLLALLCATEGDGDALWDGRHALNAMAARAHLTSLLPAAARSRWAETGGMDSLLQRPGFLLPLFLGAPGCLYLWLWGVIQGVCEGEGDRLLKREERECIFGSVGH